MLVVGVVKRYFLITTTRAKHIWQLVLIKMLGGGWVGVSYGTQTPWKLYIQIMEKSENVPPYSGKHIVRGDFLIFSSNKSFLLRNRMMEVSVNHLLLQMESKSFKLSCIRFWNNIDTLTRLLPSATWYMPQMVQSQRLQRELKLCTRTWI